jgi:hypothetical protein
MRDFCTWAVFAVGLSGCASGLVASGESANRLRLVADSVTSPPRPEPAPRGDEAAGGKAPVKLSLTIDGPVEGVEPSDDGPAPTVAPEGTAPRNAGAAPEINLAQHAIVVEDAAPNSEPSAPVVERAEPIAAPQPAPESRFRAGGDESDAERINRQLVDVPLDIRPSAGELPEDLAAAKVAGEPTIDETLPSQEPADIFCSYTPWTICYRPLYFEDIRLERYGHDVGCLQTGLSGVRFFSQIAALPYKMTVHPPRSCQCSNGFGRPGDCPLPGYGHREFRLDASLVEAAAVAGVVYILP